MALSQTKALWEESSGYSFGFTLRHRSIISLNGIIAYKDEQFPWLIIYLRQSAWLSLKIIRLRNNVLTFTWSSSEELLLISSLAVDKVFIFSQLVPLKHRSFAGFKCSTKWIDLMNEATIFDFGGVNVGIKFAEWVDQTKQYDRSQNTKHNIIRILIEKALIIFWWVHLSSSGLFNGLRVGGKHSELVLS